MKNKIIALFLASLLCACNSIPEGKAEFPKSRDDQEQERVGKLTGDEGIVLFGGKGRGSRATEGINVNSYLWRASLDTVHMMPLLSADPFGGTILTDWYIPVGGSNERYKLNIFIIGDELRSDAIKVAAFRQKRSGAGWIDQGASPSLSEEIENKILLNARSIKYNSL